LWAQALTKTTSERKILRDTEACPRPWDDCAIGSGMKAGFLGGAQHADKKA